MGQLALGSRRGNNVGLRAAGATATHAENLCCVCTLTGNNVDPYAAALVGGGLPPELSAAGNAPTEYAVLTQRLIHGTKLICCPHHSGVETPRWS